MNDFIYGCNIFLSGTLIKTSFNKTSSSSGIGIDSGNGTGSNKIYLNLLVNCFFPSLLAFLSVPWRWISGKR